MNTESTETSVIDDLIDALQSLSPFKARHMTYCARLAGDEYECTCGLSGARHKAAKAIDRARKYQQREQKEGK